MDKTMLKKRGNYDGLVMPIIKPKLQHAIKHNLTYYETIQTNGCSSNKNSINSNT